MHYKQYLVVIPGIVLAFVLYTLSQGFNNIIGIELLSAAQAMEFRRPLQSSELNEALLRSYRKVVPIIEDDRVLANDILKSKIFLFQ